MAGTWRQLGGRGLQDEQDLVKEQEPLGGAQRPPPLVAL